MSDESKRSRLFGDFTNQAGLVYPEFDRNVHVIDSIDISDRDRFDVFVSIDFGVVNPFAALLIATDGERYYVVDEYYMKEKTTIQNGHAIQAKFHRYKPFNFVICDPESKDARLILNRQCNLPNVPAPKSGKYGLIESINLVKSSLTIQADGKPLLFVEIGRAHV